MGTKLNQTHVIAITTLSIVVLALVLYMLVKIAAKRTSLNSGRVYQKRRGEANTVWQKSSAKFSILLPEFPYGTLAESFIQPELFNQMPKVIEDDELSGDCSQSYAGTLYVHLRYDVTRSVLVVLLLKAHDILANEANEINYYMMINLFPQKHKPCQSSVYRTSTVELKESLEFTIPLHYLFFQSLKFSLWSFDRFSHHEVMADTLVHLQELEKYGLSICRDIFLAKTFLMVPKASDVCGEIFFSLGYLRLTQRLAIVIIQVVNLTKLDDELPDPFVEVALLRKDKRIKVQRTSTKKKEQNPKYNETLTFDVPAEYLHESSLLLCVLSKTGKSCLEENLGTVLLGADGSGENFDHWEEMRTGTKPKPRWHKLRKGF